MIRYSLPSILMSVPEYLPKSTLSPFLTARSRTEPSSCSLPVPVAMIRPSIGLSFADSGM